MGTVLNPERRVCVPDAKPYLLLIQRTNIFGVSLDYRSMNGSMPELAGIVPVSGLVNAYAADVDTLSSEVR